MMKKPRVLFILHLPPPVHGAAMMGQYIRDSRLVNESFDCRFINLATAGSLDDIGKGGIKKIWRFLKVFVKSFFTTLAFRPQFVYVTPSATAPGFYKDFFIVQMLKLLRRKVIVHYHNKGVATRQHRKLDNWMYTRFFRGIKVILLAKNLYKDVQKYVKREDVLICPNGIEGDAHERVIRPDWHKSPKLLFLSNLFISKGVLILLDACKLLKEQGQSFTCDFVGGETHEMNAQQFSEEVAKRGLQDCVFYHGRKFGGDKATFFQNADMFIFPTKFETFGLVLIEAMQYGLPTISTQEGGIPDVVQDGETGYLLKERTAEELASYIQEMLENPEKTEQMGVNGKERYKKFFTLEAFEAKILKTLTP